MARVTVRDSELVAQTSQAGEGIQSVKLTLAGSPESVNLEAAGLKKMADVGYRVLISGETAAVVTVDESTISEDGFDLLGGAATEVVHVLLHGKIVQ